MRVLIVTPSYFPIIGGSEALARTLSNGLNDSGINADIMTYNMDKKWNVAWREETKEDGAIHVYRASGLKVSSGHISPFFPLIRVNAFPNPSFLKKFKDYDIIHFLGEADLGFPIFSYFVSKPKLMQSVGLFRNGGIYKYYMHERRFLGTVFKNFFPKLADVYLAYSDEEMELLSDLGVAKSKILALPLGLDVETFRPSPERKVDNLVIFVGRIQPIKGLHILIEALSYMETPVQLDVIGPVWDEEYGAKIKIMSQRINRNRVHAVRFLGPMQQKDLVSWYQKASVLVSPYLYETYSSVTLEALACGTPVLSTGSHLSPRGDDGIVLTSKESGELAEVLERLLRDKRMRVRCGQQGRKFVEQYHSWQSITQRLIAVYYDLLKLKNTPERED